MRKKERKGKTGEERENRGAGKGERVYKERQERKKGKRNKTRMKGKRNKTKWS